MYHPISCGAYDYAEDPAAHNPLGYEPLILAQRDFKLDKRSYVNVDTPMVIEWVNLTYLGEQTPRVQRASMVDLDRHFRAHKPDAAAQAPWAPRVTRKDSFDLFSGR